MPSPSNFWFRSKASPIPTRIRIFHLSLFLILATIISAILLNQSNLRWDWESINAYWLHFCKGWLHTASISALALASSLLFGSILAASERSNFIPLHLAARSIITTIRGTPLLAQIYIFFYIIAEVLHLQNRMLCGILSLSLFSGAYIAEILRAGIDSISSSQLESAKAIGLTRFQTYRYVILPQTVRVILPPLSGQFVSLIKDSSLLSIIGINELTQTAKNVASYTFSNFESYIILAAGYLCLTLPLALLTRFLERKFRHES